MPEEACLDFTSHSIVREVASLDDEFASRSMQFRSVCTDSVLNISKGREERNSY
jgi:hypothetical protein